MLKTSPKIRAQDLAIFGKAPAFDERLPVGRPNLGNRDRLFKRFSDMLDRSWLTNDGPFLKEFERRLADFSASNHAIMCNATVVTLQKCDPGAWVEWRGDRPSFTFIATAHALQWQEITPVFCDMDPGTHNLDPAQAER